MAYHPECEGMVEYYHTLKGMIQKHVHRFGPPWDQYLPGFWWAYRNVPRNSTGEKPSFLLFRMDFCTPTEAALLNLYTIEPANIDDFHEELMLSVLSGRALAASTKVMVRSKYKYKWSYGTGAHSVEIKLGQQVLVTLPQDETGKHQKLAHPWHGLHWVMEKRDPDLTVVPVYFHRKIKSRFTRVE